MIKQQQRTMSMPQARVEAQTLFLAKVFNWMAIGLLLTAVTAFFVSHSKPMLQLVFGNQLIFFGLIIAELVMVVSLARKINTLSATAATGMFLGYSILNGVTLSAIFLAYTMSSIALTFFVAAGMFGAMAVYGFVTKKDLNSMGSFLYMGLIGIVIASFANFFFSSPMISWVISAVGVIVFTGLTAYDMQKLSRIGASGIMDGGEVAVRRGAILGALTLYLDFINLFLMLLHFLGGSRD